MIRRAVLAAFALTLAGAVATPALADVVAAGNGGYGFCVLGTNHTNGTRDGICLYIPTS